MFGDIKSLLGYAVLGYKSDPIARNTWWRRQLPVVEDVNDEDEDMEQEEPATPALDVNRSLCRFCHENKQESGKNYIRWVNVIFRLRQQFPELDSTDDQIKNRYKLLVRKGSHLQYL